MLSYLSSQPLPIACVGYQHCSEKHLQRYITEFDFRYNNREIDGTGRSIAAIKGAEGAIGGLTTEPARKYKPRWPKP